LGAGNINIAVENAVRLRNKDASETDAEKGVWETSQFIDEFFKPDVDTNFSPRMGFSDADWRRLMRAARKANDELDYERIDLIVQELIMQELSVKSVDNTTLRLLLTGRAAYSKTFVARLTAAIAQDFPSVDIQQNEVEEGCDRKPNLQTTTDSVQNCRTCRPKMHCR
jgi:hypothetical protein